jgi:prophage regulatory protein
MKLIAPADLKKQKGIPYCPDHLRRLSKAGKFPQAIQLSGGRVAYIEAEIDAWIDDRAAERDRRAVA